MFNKHKKTFVGIIITTLLVVNFFVLIPAPKVHAGFWDAVGAGVSGATGVPIPTGAIEATVAAYNPTQIAKDVFNEILLGIANLILSTAALILGITGVLLDQALQYGVLNMAHVVGPGGELYGVINTTWTVFRDVSNMFFIFILLYAAIMTILDAGGFNMKKILRNVIIVAILLNFSLFFTKIIIDASNILTTTFYNKIASESLIDPSSTTGKLSSGLSGAFMTKLGITSLYDVDTAKSVLQTGNLGTSGWEMLKLALYGSVFMMFAAFVFVATGILFIIRFVTLIFLLIFSPLAFTAIALPNSGKYWDMWLSSLLDQAIFAPACLALMWVVLQILAGITGAHSPQLANVAAVSGQVGGAAGVGIMQFIIAIVFMVGVLVVAKKLGATGSGTLLKTGKKWRQAAQGYVGRGIVRTLPVGLADRNFFGGEFGKSKIGRGLQSVTTGAIRNQDFGSGQSVAKVDKEVKKRNEDYVKEVEKGTEKTLDKTLPILRKNRIDEINKRTPNIDTEMTAAEGRAAVTGRLAEAARQEKSRLEATLRDASSKGLALPKSQIDDITQKIEENNKKIADAQEAQNRVNELANEKKRIASERTSMEERMANKSVATKEERQQWLKPIQLGKADELDKKPTSRFGKAVAYVTSKTMLPSEKKMAAKKLRENARGAGGKDIKATLEELLEQEGQAPAKPAESAPKPA